MLHITLDELSDTHAATDAQGRRWISKSFDAVAAKDPILLVGDAIFCTI